jgi:membrane fusion protein (multidrug efflux system)
MILGKFSNLHLAKKMLAAIAALGIGLSIYGYWRHSIFYPSTDDAYIGAHVVNVAPQVSGQIVNVPIDNQQIVRKNDLLIELDQRPFQWAVNEAEARLTEMLQEVEHDESSVAAARAEVKNAEVQLANMRLKAERQRELLKKKFTSQQQVDNAEADLRSAQAELHLSEAKLQEAINALGTPGVNNARMLAAQAVLEKTRWDLEHARITAPCGGVITRLTLRPGDAVRAGISNFVLVCNETFWVDANYRETDLRRIQPGQPANIDVDMYPGLILKGVVQSIDPAAGAAFSLLPPENATGNWVKVTQRVPVRVRVLKPDPQHPLRVGASAEVTVDTRSFKPGRYGFENKSSSLETVGDGGK